MPLPGPPEINSQGWRTTCHIPANSTRGLPGTLTRSDTPVVSFTNRTFCHVLPPSAVRYTPRSAFAAQAWPTAPTNTTSGFVGSITIRETCPTLPTPMPDHARHPTPGDQRPHVAEAEGVEGVRGRGDGRRGHVRLRRGLPLPPLLALALNGGRQRYQDGEQRA